MAYAVALILAAFPSTFCTSSPTCKHSKALHVWSECTSYEDMSHYLHTLSKRTFLYRTHSEDSFPPQPDACDVIKDDFFLLKYLYISHLLKNMGRSLKHRTISSGVVSVQRVRCTTFPVHTQKYTWLMSTTFQDSILVRWQFLTPSPLKWLDEVTVFLFPIPCFSCKVFQASQYHTKCALVHELLLTIIIT